MKMQLNMCVAAAALLLSACAYGGHNGRYAGGGYADGYTDVYYDGYYGPYHDGYWGDGGAFFYDTDGHGHYSQDNGGHFHNRSGAGWRRYRGHNGAPPSGGWTHDQDHH